MNLARKQNDALWYLEDNITTEVFYGGGAGAGKSYLGAIWQIERRIKYPGTVGCIARKTLIDLKKTTLVTFWKVHKRLFANYKIHHNHDLSRLEFENGSVIYLVQLAYMPSDPEYSNIGGLELSDAWIDEANGVHEKGKDILSTRIRFECINDKPVMLITSNPCIGFLKEQWIKDKKGVPVTLKPYQKFVEADLSDNPDEKFRAIYREQLLKQPLTQRKRLLYHDWDYIENLDPWITEFDRNIHVVDRTDINNQYTLLASFDFNYSPTTSVLMQLTNKGLFVHQEFSIEGGTQRLCQEIKPYVHNMGGFEITGDVSGYKKTSNARLIGGETATDFQIVKHELKLSDFQIKDTRRYNPLHEHSRKLINYIFRNFPIFISANCIQLINDIHNAKTNEKEQLIKDREENCMDVLDCFRYGINYFFPDGTEQVERYKMQLGL